MSESTKPADAEEELQHVRIHSQCGACGYLFAAEDRLVALLHTGPALGCIILDALRFPVNAYGHTHQNWLFCRFPDCNRCAQVGETATIHMDCFKLYRQKAKEKEVKEKGGKEKRAKESVRRLWSAALARYPWPGCPALLLPPELNADRASRCAADDDDLKMLTRLPQEIARLIWNLVGQHILLRFSAVFETIDLLSPSGHDGSLSAPLGQTRGWQRGIPPTINASKPPSLIELTIDARGIKCIEGPRAGKPWSQHNVYTTIRNEQNLSINFEFGIGRLAPSNESSKLQVTDKPNVTDDYLLFSPRAPHFRVGTIDFASCSGITFFILGSQTLAIHAHTESIPSAEMTFARLLPVHQRHALWVYLPNPPSDKISAFGVRHKVDPEGNPLLDSCCYLIRTLLRGDFTIGPYLEGSKSDVAAHLPSPSTLLHTTPARGHMSILGIHPGTECSDLSPAWSGQPPLVNACYATAALQGVAGLWLFRDYQEEFCRGVIIEYRDGSQQALGSCRLGVDPAEWCADLTYFAFALIDDEREGRSSRRNVKVKVLSLIDDNSCLDADWMKCFEGDTLKVWVTSQEMVMERFAKDVD